MGDFVKGPVPTGWPDELNRHLRLHRRIDAYTQQSPSFQQSRRRLDPRFRYARGILVDVFYDHFLACRWRHYSPQPLAEFAQDVYRGLQSCFDLLPVLLQQQLPRMIEHDWLTSYQEPVVVERVLKRLEQRLQHKFPLSEGIVDLHRFQPVLENDFVGFMHEATDMIDDWLAKERTGH